VKRISSYIATHRKWIIGAALTGAASIAGYAWPDDPWIVTIISVVAVGLGVSITPNREASERPGLPAEAAQPARPPAAPAPGV
jgi:hypothetical protein